jgi:8-oxo-dGTP pyrophosphatase MutT (NUDIX family)
VFESLTALEAVLKERLQAPLPGPEAQRRFAPVPWLPGWEPEHRPATARQAAALILIHPDADRLVVPLTLRHAGLTRHAGQISLPGGAIDAGESPEAAALREAEEEIGVDPARIRLLGQLSTLWLAVSNFVVHPFVGVTSERPAFRLDAAEVTDLLLLPVDHLCDRTRIQWASGTRQSIAIRYPFLEIEGHRLWGATAMILGEFAALVDPSHGPGPYREPGGSRTITTDEH